MGWFTRKIIETQNGVVSISRDIAKLVSGDNYYIDCSILDGQKDAYEKCDIISSLVNRRAESIANLRFKAIDPDTGKTIKTAESQKILKDLKRPNQFEDFKLFFGKLDKYCSLHGHAFVRIAPSGFVYVLPNEFVEPVYKNETDVLSNRVVDYYLVNDMVSQKKYSANEIFIFHDNIISDKDDSMLGGSRLASLSNVITTYVVAWEVRSELYANGGAKSIISMGADDPQILMNINQDVVDLQEAFKRYGLRKGFWKFLIVKTKATVQKLTSPMSEFEFNQTINDCKIACCNAFSCPPVLFGVEQARYKATTEAEKEYYRQSAMPIAEYYIQQWLIMKGKINLPFDIVPDYSHLEFYQEAKLQEGIAKGQIANAIASLMGIQGKEILSVEEARIWLDLKD